MFQGKDNTFTTILSLLKVKHTTKYSKQYFNEHPHKYNLFGISKLLSDYGVRNAGTRIENKEQDLYNIETPFIAHFGSEFVAVAEIGKDTVKYFRNGKKLTLSVDSFLQAWSGIILLAETSSESIEPDYKAHKKEALFAWIQKIILSIAACFIAGWAYFHNLLFQNLGLNILLLINFIGVYIGYLLVLKQLNIQSKYADKICSLFSKSDCNNVLESDAAKLWGVFSWSEIGLGYFVANGLIITLLPQFISYIALINIAVLPYSFWSVWYQKVKAKQWCPLCLLVMVLLWSIFSINCLFGFIQMPTSILPLMITGSLYAGCMLIFNLFIPKLSEGNQIAGLKQEINSIKANEEVFLSLLKQQPAYEVNPADSQILFGKPNSPLQLTILTNPFCNPCAKMHQRVEKFLQETNRNVCIRYIFSSFEPELDFANKGLIAVYLEKEKNEFESIIADWFEKGKALKETFFENLYLDNTNPAIETEFQKHETWKGKTQLRATPMILVNGYQLPGNYKIEDLRYFTNLKINVDNRAEVVRRGTIDLAVYCDKFYNY